MSAQHTPGPWIVAKLGSINPWTDALSIMADENTTIAHTTRGFEGAYDDSGHHDETSCAWANARLISAAPDLLNALQAMVATTGDWNFPAKDNAIAAIAKATTS